MIESAMNGVTSDLTITPRVMAAQGGYSRGGASNTDLISGTNTALNTALVGGGSVGDIVISVYIGGDMIDEIVVMAQQRMNLRSGGTQRRDDGSRHHTEGCGKGRRGGDPSIL